MRSLEVEHLSWHSECRCEQPGVSLDCDVERELSPSPAWRQAASSGGARGRAAAAAGQPTPDIHDIIVMGDDAVVRLTWTLTTEVNGVKDRTTEEGMDIFRRQPDG